MFGRGDALPMHGGKKNDNGVSFSVVNIHVSLVGYTTRISFGVRLELITNNY
jgi:hypothetical protein